jgi:hypothetical protein
VLLLENHDDFGGHAKRNEFEWNGRTILGYGGSQSLEAPSAYSDVAKGLLARIGVEKARLKDAYDQDFYRRNGLGAGVYFDRATYGTDRLVRTDIVDLSAFLPVAASGVANEDAIEQMPLSEPARRELQRLFGSREDRLPDHTIFREPGYLRTISYRDFLTKHLGVDQPEVIALLQDVPSAYWGHGIDAVPALATLACKCSPKASNPKRRPKRRGAPEAGGETASSSFTLWRKISSARMRSRTPGGRSRSSEVILRSGWFGWGTGAGASGATRRRIGHTQVPW